MRHPPNRRYNFVGVVLRDVLRPRPVDLLDLARVPVRRPTGYRLCGLREQNEAARAAAQPVDRVRRRTSLLYLAKQRVIHEAPRQGRQTARLVDRPQMRIVPEDLEVPRRVRFPPQRTVPNQGLPGNQQFAPVGHDPVQSHLAEVQLLLPGCGRGVRV